jgi:hypothetical protein
VFSVFGLWFSVFGEKKHVLNLQVQRLAEKLTEQLKSLPSTDLTFKNQKPKSKTEKPKTKNPKPNPVHPVHPVRINRREN